MNTIDDLFCFSDLCDSEKFFKIGAECGCVSQNTCMSGVTCSPSYYNPIDSCPPYRPRALYPESSNCGVPSDSNTISSVSSGNSGNTKGLC